MKTYVTIRSEEMVRVLNSGKVRPTYTVCGNELVAVWPVAKTTMVVKVYTSIHNGQSAGKGSDAIRICLVDTATDRGVAKTQRTLRTVGWQTRMRAKIRDMFLTAKAA